ncbi:MAG: DUF4198 domain-containing protein [Desulfovibrionaceae bacterium]|nr:DUF4198 domain-containing protein [Desulfovibrionaceae bacterium]
MLLLLWLFCFSLLGFKPALAQVTLLIPARPDLVAPLTDKKDIEPKERANNKKNESLKNQPPPTKPQAQTKDPPQDNSKNDSKEAKDQPQAPLEKPKLPEIKEEIDILITMMEPIAQKCLPMDRPQAFAHLRYDHLNVDAKGQAQAERIDLLGDVEEILYLGQRAWGANVGLVHAGMYKFLLETKPWWDPNNEKFVQHFVKSMVPVYGEEVGWSENSGQPFEIIPLSRPFGILAPSEFKAQVLLNGQPLAHTLVNIERINTDGQKVPTPWHESIVVKTDLNGYFSFVANKPGWWCCKAKTKGSPLKGPDGQPKNLEIGALFWFYTDHVSETRDRKSY